MEEVSSSSSSSLLSSSSSSLSSSLPSSSTLPSSSSSPSSSLPSSLSLPSSSLSSSSSSSLSSSVLHENNNIKCRCGCVPNILSLFEMAALRAERKKELAMIKNDLNDIKEENQNNIEIYDMITELDTNVTLPLRIIGYNVSKFLNKENGNMNFNKTPNIIGLLLAHGLGPKNPKEKSHLNDKYVDIALKAINDINDTKIKHSIISIAYTARGHGNSFGWENTAEINPEQFTWQNKLSDDMISLANKFQLSKFIACGSSMGSATSLYAAIKCPELVHSIILMRPPTAWNDRLLRRKTLLSSADKCQEANKDELHHLVIRGTAYSDLPLLEDKELYEKIKCPLLILTIEGDDSHPISTAEVIKSMIPHAQLYISDNEKNAKKHWPNIIKTFIEQHMN